MKTQPTEVESLLKTNQTYYIRIVFLGIEEGKDFKETAM